MIQIDMPMPMDCEECPLNDEYAECALLGEFVAKCGRLPDCPLREMTRCGKCRHYQGNHDVPGCAPCDFWGIGEVMWDDYCKRGERWDDD
jgi:hypothetical protein